MICLFNSTASKSDLTETNGDYILNMLCTSAIITEELNGEYSFDGVFRISSTFPKQLYDMLAEESILKIDEEYGTEYFRIAKVIKTTKNVTVFARHITISDILTLWCEDVRPTELNGAGAIAWIYDNAIGKKILTVNSDIGDTSTAYYVNKNVYEALFTADNSFLNRWGGEVYRRGFNLSINKKIGKDRGVTIRSKKNLTGFEANTTVDSLKTRIYPHGYDGITIEEKFIDSEYINNYARIYTSLEKFEDIKVNGENVEDGFETLEEAQEELKKRVKLMYEVDKVDLLTATYRISFIELSKTEEYKNYSILEETWLGDTIEVIEDNLGVNISVRVLKRKYDVLKQRRTETELSNKDIKEKPPTIQQIVTEIEKRPTTDTILQIAKEQATAILNAGINGYVVVNKNEILIMDTEDKNTATKVWRMNVNGIGYSSTGYYGTYGTAITMEGQIVADFITTGVLNANLIKTGIIKAMKGESFINLDSGEVQITGELRSKFGDHWVGLDYGGITFKDAHNDEQLLRAAAVHQVDNRDQNGVNFALAKYGDYIRFSHIDKEDLTTGWSTNNKQYRFMDMWSSDVTIGSSRFRKGINVYSPMYLNNGLRLNYKGDANYENYITSTAWNSVEGLLGLYGDNGTCIGYQEGSNLMSRIVVTEAAMPGTGDNIKSWGNWNCSGYTVHNATFSGKFVNSYANLTERTFTETNCIEAENKQVRINFENVQLKNRKAILNIPKRYMHINTGYIISSIVKKGRGDVWIAEELENKFVIEGTEDIRVNIEVIIKLEDNSLYISSLSDTNDQPLCIDMTVGQLGV